LLTQNLSVFAFVTDNEYATIEGIKKIIKGLSAKAFSFRNWPHTLQLSVTDFLKPLE
jgi:hypothetical protein